MENKSDIRVRIAPSPTGNLHFGTVRTALFNWLFAKKMKGSFIVRIEDTDAQRSLPIYESDILNGLKSLHLDWDEGPDIGGPYAPYRQSERKDIYKEYLQKLLRENKAFRCFCTKEEVEEGKKIMLANGMIPRYNGVCRNITDDEYRQKVKEGIPSVIRLVVPRDTRIKLKDVIRGEISVNSDTIGDFIIAKNLDNALYNFAVVVDDYLMKISHIIRGEDHISNTPKQILIQRALGFETPEYAHLPLVLSPDKTKLSKRNLDISFNNYIKEGYLPEAILNFLVLIGWNPGDDEEMMSLEQMVNKFDIKKIHKGGGSFNMDKLDWFNARYIAKLTDEELKDRLIKFVPSEWVDSRIFDKVIKTNRDRIKKLSDFKTISSFFFSLPNYDVDMLLWKDDGCEVAKQNLTEVIDAIKNIDEDDFTKENLENVISSISSRLGVGNVLWPLRVSLSGMKSSPGPFDIMYVIGKDESINRIRKAIDMLCSS